MTARFSAKEMKVIDIIMKKEEWTKSKFLRNAVLMGVTAILANYATEPTSALTKAIRPVLDVLAKTSNLKEAEKEAQRISASMSSKEREEITAIIAMLNDVINAFKVHKPRGRPKQQRGKRGRHTPWQE